MPLAELDRLTISYLRRGDGSPLLLIAGIPAVATDWLPLIERLEYRRELIACDNRSSVRLLDAFSGERMP